jgi:tRNA 2-thiocytidine biosynthesis protein TtcA
MLLMRNLTIDLDYNRNFGKWFVNDVSAAIRNYGLFESGEKVCVALSGGKDSTTLLYILAYLNRYSRCTCVLYGAHVKTARYDASVLKRLCENLGAIYCETGLERTAQTRVKSHCYLCGRLKRGALARLCAENGIRKLAFGHHADDAAETFLMNLFEHGAIGSFAPRVEVGAESPVIIRPMVYLAEATIRRIHTRVRLPLLEYACPFAAGDLRAKYKLHLSAIEKLLGTRGLAKRIVRGLEHVDTEDSWESLKVETQ